MHCLGIAALEHLMHEFSLHHRNAASVPGFTPRGGELVSGAILQRLFPARIER